MTPSETAQQLRLAATIIETGYSWEYNYDKGFWQKSSGASMKTALHEGWPIRLALATPPDGRALHNPDNLTAEQVGAGWRLTLPNENPHDDAELWYKRDKCFTKRKHYTGLAYGELNTYRVPLSVPWPEVEKDSVWIDPKCGCERSPDVEKSAPCPIHSPKPDPYAELKAAHAAGKVIQFRFRGSEQFRDINPKACGGPSWKYPVENYRIKPATVPLGPEDVPPGSVFRSSCWVPDLFIAPSLVYALGVTWMRKKMLTDGADAEAMTFKALHDGAWQINRSIPLTGRWNPDAWEPCHKTI